MSVWDMVHLIPKPEEELKSRGIMKVIMEDEDYTNIIIAQEFSYIRKHHHGLVCSSRALEKIGGFIDSIKPTEVREVGNLQQVLLDSTIAYEKSECFRFWISYYTLQKLVKERKLKLEDVYSFREISGIIRK